MTLKRSKKELKELLDFWQTVTAIGLVNGLPESLEEISDPDSAGFCIINGCLIHYAGDECKMLIPEGVVAVAPYAFKNVYRIEDVVCPASLRYIGEHGFCECHGLKHIDFNEGLEYIGRSAFKNLPIEGPIDFPKSLKEIGANAFRRTNISFIRIHEGIESIDKDAFFGCFRLGVTELPACWKMEKCKVSRIESDNGKNGLSLANTGNTGKIHIDDYEKEVKKEAQDYVLKRKMRLVDNDEVKKVQLGNAVYYFNSNKMLSTEQVETQANLRKRLDEIKKKEFDLTDHHPFGPSVLARRKSCPGSYWMELDCEGLDFIKPDVGDVSKKVYSRISKFVRSGANEEGWFCKKFANFLKNELSDAESVETEKRVYFYRDGQVLYFGIADLVIRTKSGELKVYKWKNTEGWVYTVANWLQVSAYAMATAQEYGCNKATAYLCKTFISDLESDVFLKKINSFKGIESEIMRIIENCKSEECKLHPTRYNCMLCKGYLCKKCSLAVEKYKEEKAPEDEKDVENDKNAGSSDIAKFIEAKLRKLIEK